jgi:hypothetical protein
LFEEEGHARGAALIAQIDDPLWIHRARARAGFFTRVFCRGRGRV